jgi:hypothetical protein
MSSGTCGHGILRLRILSKMTFGQTKSLYKDAILGRTFHHLLILQILKEIPEVNKSER